MGTWGSAPWDNDEAADWFGDLFEETGLAERVAEALRAADPEDEPGVVRAAAHMLNALGHVYVWPVDQLENHLELAVRSLERVAALEDFAEDQAVADELDALRQRLAEFRTPPPGEEPNEP